MERPLVSVIIPCYNCIKYVEEAVMSIVNQTYQNMEILITDDYSSDGTYEILKKLAKLDKRIKLYRNQKNEKIIETLNKMIHKSNGKYIARMDSDDISVLTRIEEQVSFLEINSDIDFCGTNCIHINNKGKIIAHKEFPGKSQQIQKLIKYGNIFAHPTIMIRSVLLKQCRYNPEFIHAEDYELWCRLIYEKKANAVNLQKYLLKYRVTKGQISQKYETEQKEHTAKIMEKYSVTDMSDIEIHKMIFCTINSKRVIQFDEIRDYIKVVYEDIKKIEFNLSYPFMAKLLLFLRNNCIKLFMYYLFTPIGIRTTLKRIRTKLI